MKKVLSLLLCTVIVLSSLAFAVPTGAILYRKGDVNSDGSVNAIDSYYLRQSLAGVNDSADAMSSDVNSDSILNSSDSFVLKLHIAGSLNIDTVYPEGCGWKGFHIMGTPIREYTVVVSNPDNANMVFAAEELSKYVRLGDGGSDLQIKTGESAVEKQILLLEDETGEMGTDGFNIKTVGDDLVITAGALRGTMYAVYEILEAYFHYSFYPYGEYELDKYLNADVPEGTDDTQIPHVRYRCVGINGYHDRYVESSTVKSKLSGSTDQSALNNAKYGYGIQRDGGNGHSFETFISEDDMAANGIAKRCLTNEKVFEICKDTMIAFIDAKIASGSVIGKNLTEITCSYDQYDVPCTCRTCAKINREEVSLSGNLVRFVNRVHAEIMKVYPDIRIVMCAYGDWHDAPKVTSLNEGITLLYCWNGCANHMLGKEGCTDKGNYLGTTNKKTEADFLAWTEKCSDIYVWYYPTNIYYMLSPQPNFDNLYNDFQWFINNGAKGFYVKGTDGGSFESLNGHLIADLMWDPDMTNEEYDQKTKEYLKDIYGYGWIYIYEYMSMLVEAGDLKGCVLNDFELPFDMYSKDYFIENYDTMISLFQRAASAADNEDQLENIEKLSVHMHFLGLSATYETSYVNGSENERAVYAQTWEWLYDYINSHDMTMSNEQSHGIDAPFTLDKNPLNVIYGDGVGDGER